VWFPVEPGNAAFHELLKYTNGIETILWTASSQVLQGGQTPFEAAKTIWDTGLAYFQGINRFVKKTGGFAAMGNQAREFPERSREAA
jgi:hypothetical protein